MKLMDKFNSYMSGLVAKAFCLSNAFNYYDSVNNHRLSHNKCLSDNVLVIVHPLFAESIVKDSFIDSYVNYKSVLSEALSLSSWSKALFTFALAYNETKDLVESGVFNRTYFTEFCSGIPELETDVHDFINKRVVFLGSYAEQCVSELMASFLDAGVSDVSVLSEGVFFSDYARVNNESNDFLLDYYMRKGEIPLVKIIHLGDLIK